MNRTKHRIDEFTVVLGLPPNELKPNSRPGYFAKAKKVKEYRLHSAENAKARARHTPASKTMPWSEVVIQVTYYHKTRAFGDPDNILASLKSAFDGLVDSGILTDDKDVTYPPVVRGYDKEKPRVELRVRNLRIETMVSVEVSNGEDD